MSRDRLQMFLRRAANEASSLEEVRAAARQALKLSENTRDLSEELGDSISQNARLSFELTNLKEEMKMMKAKAAAQLSKPFSMTELWCLNSMMECGYEWLGFDEINKGEASPAGRHAALKRLIEIGAVEVCLDVSPRRYRVNPSMDSDLRDRINRAGHATIFQSVVGNLLADPPAAKVA